MASVNNHKNKGGSLWCAPVLAQGSPLHWAVAGHRLAYGRAEESAKFARFKETPVGEGPASLRDASRRPGAPSLPAKLSRSWSREGAAQLGWKVAGEGRSAGRCAGASWTANRGLRRPRRRRWEGKGGDDEAGRAGRGEGGPRGSLEDSQPSIAAPRWIR
jgi:hypothetical protein